MHKFIGEHHANNFDKIVKAISKKAGSIENAEDIVQSAYERALRWCKSDFNFDKWFGSVVANCLRAFKNDERRAGATSELTEDIEADEVLEQPEKMDRMLRKSILAEIDSKNTASRLVLSLYFVKHYSISDIVELTGLSVMAVKKSVFRFKKLLSNKYGVGI